MKKKKVIEEKMKKKTQEGKKIKKAGSSLPGFGLISV